MRFAIKLVLAWFGIGLFWYLVFDGLLDVALRIPDDTRTLLVVATLVGVPLAAWLYDRFREGVATILWMVGALAVWAGGIALLARYEMPPWTYFLVPIPMMFVVVAFVAVIGRVLQKGPFA